jgi:hypothetical protein
MTMPPIVERHRARRDVAIGSLGAGHRLRRTEDA